MKKNTLIGGLASTVLGCIIAVFLLNETTKIIYPAAHSSLIQEFSDFDAASVEAELKYKDSQLLHFHVLRQDSRRSEDKKLNLFGEDGVQRYLSLSYAQGEDDWYNMVPSPFKRTHYPVRQCT